MRQNNPAINNPVKFRKNPTYIRDSFLIFVTYKLEDTKLAIITLIPDYEKNLPANLKYR